MVKIKSEYKGKLRVEATHQPSGKILVTDAPVDNHGKGESFSPTDLVATGLGSCMATIIGIVADRSKIEIKDMKFSVEKLMSEDSPRRIARLNLEFKINASADGEQRKLLENAALNCPVAKSIHPDIEVNAVFHWT